MSIAIYHRNWCLRASRPDRVHAVKMPRRFPVEIFPTFPPLATNHPSPGCARWFHFVCMAISEPGESCYSTSTIWPSPAGSSCLVDYAYDLDLYFRCKWVLCGVRSLSSHCPIVPCSRSGAVIGSILYHPMRSEMI